MRLLKLKLKNFRNHSNRQFSFDGKSTLISGPNGSGKTNLLEAIHLLSTTKSLRASYDREMISHDKTLTRVEAKVTQNKKSSNLELMVIKNDKFDNKSSKKVKLDKVNKSLQDFTGALNTVLFTPHDVEMLTSSPSIRRKYVDLIFFQVDKDYKRAYRDYAKAVRQRNKILEQIRDFGKGSEQIEFWNKKIIDTGSAVQDKRQKFFDFVQKNIGKYGEMLNSKEATYDIEYLISSLSKERIKEYEKAEIGAARTLIGPSRDDFAIRYDGFDVSKYGSRGQKRIIILALKMCEIDFITKFAGKRPILLLDDIFSELDEFHKEAVKNIVDLQQTVITSAENSDLKGSFNTITL